MFQPQVAALFGFNSFMGSDRLTRTPTYRSSRGRKHVRSRLPSRLFGILMLLGILPLVAVSPVVAQGFDVPSDGSDGVFAPTTNTVIDLGLAGTGAWNTPGQGNGVYDSEQWLIVFKYASVNVPAGVTVTFKNHPKNPPVVWLVDGAVEILGNVRLDCPNGAFAAGPGGFRGGNSVLPTSGFGPGAGNRQNLATFDYGNATCFPLVGGSGGGGVHEFGPILAFGGGGAMLIASNTRVQLAGELTSNSPTSFLGFSGTGGMIRVVAPLVDGGGILQARGLGNGALGKIRVEANTVDLAPSTPGYSYVPLGKSFVFLRESVTPSVRVLSVAGVSAPTDPSAGFQQPADLVVGTPNVEVLVECRNVPTNATVKIHFRSAQGDAMSTVTATLQSGDATLSTWIASGSLGTSQGFATVQAEVMIP